MTTEAERVTRALGGEWRSGQGLAPCPVCQPEGRKDQRALSISDKSGVLLVYCHKSQCAAVAELRARGLIGGALFRGVVAKPQQKPTADDQANMRRLRYAHDLFAAGVCCEGTAAAKYLESRGIDGLRFAKLRQTLRFHPEVLHTPSGERLPAMLAQIRGPKGEPLGVHRTYLRPDGSGKADVKPAKMMLGPSSGGAVRFGPDAQVIALAEGIETALSILKASRMTTFATLSTSGMKGLILPPLPFARVVIIAADADPAGIDAAQVTAVRLEAEGRSVSVIHPPKPGADYNDWLRGSE